MPARQCGRRAAPWRPTAQAGWRPRCPSCRRRPRRDGGSAAGRRATPTGARCTTTRGWRSPGPAPGAARGRAAGGRSARARSGPSRAAGRISQPRRSRSVPRTATGTIGAPGLEHEPADAALRARRAGPGARGCPPGKMPTTPPRSRITRAVSIASSSDSPRRIGKGAERQQEPGLPALVEQLDLRDEVQRPPEAAPDHERVREAAVVRGHQHRALLGHVLEPDAPQPEVDVEEGLQDHADDPVDGHHGPALTGDLVGALEIQGAVRRYPAVHEAVTGHSPSLGARPAAPGEAVRSDWPRHRNAGEAERRARPRIRTENPGLTRTVLYH